jgi:hypothetical protein
MELYEPNSPATKLGWTVRAAGVLRLAAVVTGVLLAVLILRPWLAAAWSVIQPFLISIRHALGR